MKFNIEPQDLQTMIGRLSQYASSLGQVSSSMKSYANLLSSTWKDPQYIGFVNQVESMGKQLRTSEETLKQMERQLAILKQNLEKAHADFRRLS